MPRAGSPGSKQGSAWGQGQWHERAMKSGSVAMKSRAALTLGYHVTKGHDPPLLNHEELTLDYRFTGHCVLNICPPNNVSPILRQRLTLLLRLA